jgi:hypothetical protein
MEKSLAVEYAETIKLVDADFIAQEYSNAPSSCFGSELAVPIARGNAAVH